MIVQRIFLYPKVGRQDDLLDRFKAMKQRVSSNPHLHARRIYSARTGNSAQVAVELEFENHAELGKFWAKYNADPEPRVEGETVTELHDRYWTNEIWDLVE